MSSSTLNSNYSLVIMVAAMLAVPVTSVADIIYLSDGTNIPNARVLETTANVTIIEAEGKKLRIESANIVQIDESARTGVPAKPVKIQRPIRSNTESQMDTLAVKGYYRPYKDLWAVGVMAAVVAADAYKTAQEYDDSINELKGRHVDTSTLEERRDRKVVVAIVSTIASVMTFKLAFTKVRISSNGETVQVGISRDF